MAKLKCWKKEGEGIWENKKGQKSLLIQTYYASDDVTIQKFDRNKPISKGGIKQIGKVSFDSVESATKYAKSYMKKHDKC